MLWSSISVKAYRWSNSFQKGDAFLAAGNADLASLSQLSPANPDLLEHSRLVLLQSCE